MITYGQAIVLGLMQGISELFPVSSLGHSVILPSLLGWTINQSDPLFLTFLVATHTATAIVLVCFFWKDWVKIVGGIWRSLREREIHVHDTYAKLGWLIIVSTIPAGILGILFQESLKNLFASSRFVAILLVLNGIMLYFAELLRRKKKEIHTEEQSDNRIAKLTWFEAIKVGLLQSIALLPGFSRTGAAITGGLLSGLSHEDAARYAFLLATPVIAAASVLKLPDLFEKSNEIIIGPTLVGSLCAGIAAFFSVKFLVKYFKTETLIPFALYCIGVGVVSSLIFLFR